MKDPRGSRRIAGIFARHDMALELICGADSPGIVSSGASSGDRNRSYGRNRPPLHAPPTQKSTAEPSPEHDWVDTRNHTAKAASAIGRGAPRDRPDPQGPANAKTNSRNQDSPGAAQIHKARENNNSTQHKPRSRLAGAFRVPPNAQEPHGHNTTQQKTSWGPTLENTCENTGENTGENTVRTP